MSISLNVAQLAAPRGLTALARQGRGEAKHQGSSKPSGMTQGDGRKRQSVGGAVSTSWGKGRGASHGQQEAQGGRKRVAVSSVQKHKSLSFSLSSCGESMLQGQEG